MQNRTLKIKICGMRDPGNISAVAKLLPDYMGFIYYARSKRFAGGLLPVHIDGLPLNIRKTGVFVNSDRKEVLSIAINMGFHAIQLHGVESPEYCREIKESGLEVIKVFSIGNEGGFERWKEYQEYCDLYLFDTAGIAYGGTGKKFSWERLKDYTGEKGFFLSGGLAPGDLEEILELKHPQLYGVDLNSGFETEPGMKNPVQLETFIREIRRVDQGNKI